MELFIGDKSLGEINTLESVEASNIADYYLPYASFNADFPDGYVGKDIILHINGEEVKGRVKKNTNGEYEYVFEKKYTNEGKS